jgi:hypothetical protein
LALPRPAPHSHLRRRGSLVTDEREQKPEQHLEIAAYYQNPHVLAHVELALDTARRFTEAAGQTGVGNDACRDDGRQDKPHPPGTRRLQRTLYGVAVPNIGEARDGVEVPTLVMERRLILEKQLVIGGRHQAALHGPGHRERIRMSEPRLGELSIR